MSRLLLDTNVIVDYMVPDRPEHPYAAQLLERMADSDDRGMVSVGTLKDAYYICRRYLDEPQCRELVRMFVDLLEVPSVTQRIVREAAWSDEPDFEDGLIRAIAETNRADFIITRDRSAFRRSTVRSMSAREWLELFAQ